MIKEIGFLMIPVAIVAVVISVLTYSLNRSDQHECYHWQAQAKQYPGFYITTWQKQQCDYWKIEIDAPVATDL